MFEKGMCWCLVSLWFTNISCLLFSGQFKFLFLVLEVEYCSYLKIVKLIKILILTHAHLQKTRDLSPSDGDFFSQFPGHIYMLLFPFVVLNTCFAKWLFTWSSNNVYISRGRNPMVKCGSDELIWTNRECISRTACYCNIMSSLWGKYVPWCNFMYCISKCPLLFSQRGRCAKTPAYGKIHFIWFSLFACLIA